MVRLRGDRVLWAITLLGAALRFLNLAGDLPCVLHYDEPTLIDNAVWMWTNHTANPLFFNYPTGLIYLLAGLFGLVLAGGMAIGRFASWDAALAWLSTGTYPRPPQGGVLYFYPTWGVPALYLIARSVSAIAGTATIPLVYAVARRADCSVGVARLAAFAVAVSSLAVEHSHLATTDAAATCLATVALLLILRAEKAGTRAWIAAGAMAGLAAGFKYNLGLVAGLLALLAVWRARGGDKSVWGKLGLAALSAVAAFLLTTPFALIDPARFGRDLAYELHRVTSVTEMFTGAREVEASTAAKLLDIFWSHLGLGGIAATLLGLWLTLRSRRFAPTAVAMWVLLCLLPMLRWQSLYARYLLGLWPALLLLATIGVWETARYLSRRKPAAEPLLIGALALAAFLPSEIRLVQRETTRARPDPRVELSSWINEHIPEGTQLVAERSGPFPDPERTPVEVVDFLGRSTPAQYLDRGLSYLIETGRVRLIEGKAPFREVLQNEEAIRAASDVLWSKQRYAVYKLRGQPEWFEPVTRAIAESRFEDARRSLSAAIEQDRWNRLAWQLLGETEVARGDTLTAMAALMRAAAIDSLQLEVALLLSKLHIARGEYDEAIHRLELADRTTKEDATTLNNFAVAYLSRARVRLRAGDRPGAESDWTRALGFADRYRESGKGDPRFNALRDQVVRQGARWGFVAPGGTP